MRPTSWPGQARMRLASDPMTADATEGPRKPILEGPMVPVPDSGLK